MKNLILSLCLILGIIHLGTAQTLFQHIYDDPNSDPQVELRGEKTVELSNGDMMAAATMLEQSYSWSKIYVMKTKSDGNEIWTRTFDFPDATNHYVHDMILSSNGNVVIVGAVYRDVDGVTSYQAFVLEVNAAGNRVWERLYQDGTEAWSIVQCRNSTTNAFDGTYAITGREARAGEEEISLWVARISSTSSPKGNFVWSKTYQFEDASQTNPEQPGNFLFYVDHIGYDIIQTDEEEFIPTPPFYQHDGVQDDGFAVVGVRNQYTSSSYINNAEDVFCAKLKSDGSLEYFKYYDLISTHHGRAYSIVETDEDQNGVYDDGYLVAGQTENTSNNGANGLVIKVEDDLSYDWHAEYTDASFPGLRMGFRDLHFNGSEYYVAGGCINGALIAKLDLNGGKLFAQHHGRIGGGIVGTNESVTPSSNGTWIVCGEIYTNSAGTNRLSISTFDANGSSNECSEDNFDWNELVEGMLDWDEQIEELDPLDDQPNINSMAAIIYPVDRPLCGDEIFGYKAMCVGSYDLCALSPEPNWEFFVESSSGIKSFPKTDNNGNWSTIVDLNYSQTIKEVFKPGYVPVSPIPAEYTIPANGTPLSNYDFTNYECQDYCNIIPNMVAYFHFQRSSGQVAENLLGLDGNLHDAGGQLTGSNVIGTTVPIANGIIISYSENDQTFDLDANDVYVSVPDHSSLQFGSGDFTVEGWVKLPDPTGSAQRCFARKRQGSGPNPTGWEFGFANNSYYFNLHGSNHGHINGWTGGTTNAGMLGFNTWHHVAFVVDKTALKLRVFVDGSLYSNRNIALYGTNSSSDYDNGGPMEIAKELEGLVDEFSVYNRALTASEVAIIHSDHKCWDYMKIRDYTTSCNGVNTSAQGSFDIINGYLSNNDYVFALAPLPSGTNQCNVDGPYNFTPNNGALTVNSVSSFNTGYSIPCEATYNGNNRGCYQLTAYLKDEELCMIETNQGTSLEYSRAEEFVEEHLPSGMIENEAGVPITAYPNPSKGIVNIKGDQVIQSVHVISLSGKLMLEVNEINSRETQIDLGDFDAGVYLLRITTDKQVETQKIKVE